MVPATATAASEAHEATVFQEVLLEALCREEGGILVANAGFLNCEFFTLVITSLSPMQQEIDLLLLP